VATNRLPAASRRLHEDSIVNLEIGVRPQAACGSTLTLDAMEDIKKKHSAEEIIKIVNDHIENGEKSKARYMLLLTTNLGKRRRLAIIEGQEKLEIENIIKTDLTDINKFGCTFGSVAILLVSFSLFCKFFL